MTVVSARRVTQANLHDGTWCQLTGGAWHTVPLRIAGTGDRLNRPVKGLHASLPCRRKLAELERAPPHLEQE